jgi:hypothetical protein
MKPQKNTSTIWSTRLAYCIGLLASDGDLSKDGRHISFVSKDLDLIISFKNALKLSNTVSTHSTSGFSKDCRYYRIQFGDVNFYQFLIGVGLTPAKSKTLGRLLIPDQMFSHFLRGSFDGDGTFYSYWDKRWRSSFLYYLVFISASRNHLLWIQTLLNKFLKVKGSINKKIINRAYQLRYAKSEASKVMHFMYKDAGIFKLERKHEKVYNALDIDRKNKSARVL